MQVVYNINYWTMDSQLVIFFFHGQQPIHASITQSTRSVSTCPPPQQVTNRMAHTLIIIIKPNSDCEALSYQLHSILLSLRCTRCCGCFCAYRDARLLLESGLQSPRHSLSSLHCENCRRLIYKTSGQAHFVRMEAKARRLSNPIRHEALVVSYRAQVLAVQTVNADALVAAAREGKRVSLRSTSRRISASLPCHNIRHCVY